MNIEHVNEWVTGLRETSAGQCQSTLASHDGKGWRYCCLGLGETIRTGREPHESLRHAGVIRRDVDPIFGRALPVGAFHEWLGLDPDDVVEDGDVYVDWPTAGQAWIGDWPGHLGYVDEPGLIMQGEEREPYFQRLGCADLNDDLGLTFDQIADVIAYFGVTS